LTPYVKKSQQNLMLKFLVLCYYGLAPFSKRRVARYNTAPVVRAFSMVHSIQSSNGVNKLRNRVGASPCMRPAPKRHRSWHPRQQSWQTGARKVTPLPGSHAMHKLSCNGSVCRSPNARKVMQNTLIRSYLSPIMGLIRSLPLACQE